MSRLPAMPVRPEDVEAAERRIEGVAWVTPVLRSTALDAAVGAQVLVKAECCQRTGAFKFRGAYNAVAALPAEVRRRGVVCFSTGNHGRAVAVSARLHAVPATVVMPHDAPNCKRDAVLAAGARLVPYDRHTDDREALARGVAEGTGATLITPCDDANVIAGQGTVARELVRQVGALDVLLVSVGGGGLMAGCAVAGKTRLPRLRIVGVEPVAGDDTKRSLEAGRRVEIPVPDTILDGQRNTAPAALAFEVNRCLADQVVLVTDDEVVAAMVFAFEELKVVLEPSGAAGIAALMARRLAVAGQRVGVVLSGGNIGSRDFRALTGYARVSARPGHR